MNPVLLLLAFQVRPVHPQLVSNGLDGYISMSTMEAPKDYGYGVSLYATAWPLTEKPLRGFQIGLASMWIVPENREINTPLLPHGTMARDNWPERGPSYRDVFQTIEGGLGFWGDTRFGSSTAKFRMNGTANGYNHMISTSGWGFGSFENTTALAADQMGIAQLSSRILVPPDGVTFRKDTCGQLLGYAWMALPLTDAKATSAGLPVPTGNESWTLFFNTSNFKGPVAFFTPTTWTRVSRTYAPAVGRGLDARPGLVTGGAIEVNTVPRFEATDTGGTLYCKIPRIQFPADQQGRTVLVHNMTHYSKFALFDEVDKWAHGGPAAAGKFEPSGTIVMSCRANPLNLTQGPKKLHIDGFDRVGATTVFGKSTFGIQWSPDSTDAWMGRQRGSLPQYFKRVGDRMTPVAESEVPDSLGLKSAQFKTAVDDHTYTSPTTGDNCWMKPGPKAGPFYAKLTDGSVVTYYWYRFIDQPAMQDADLSAAERNRLQALVEKIHRAWTPNREYMPHPEIGKLATLDPALLVKPPRGLEVGYVPIAVRQAKL